MILSRLLLGLGLSLGLLVSAASAEAAKPKKGKGVLGSVTAVKVSDNDKDAGTITVKTIARKKKGAAAPAGEDKTFTVSKDTKVVKVTGKKQDRKEEAAALADIKEGVRVLVQADKGGNVQKIALAPGKKAKKNAQN